MQQLSARRGRVLVAAALLAGGALLAIPGTSTAKPATPDHSVASPAVARQSASEVLAYWTPERMTAAKPHPAAGRAEKAKASPGKPSQAGAPGFVNGRLPAPQYAEADDMAVAQSSTSDGDMPSATPTHNGSYPAPFSRWLPFGRFTNYPNSTISKMFFTQRGLNYVCSASTVNLDRVLTAGHCVHEGGTSSSTGWSTNVLFCPSYNNVDGVNPTRGCWGAVALATSVEWYANGNFDRDWGGAHTQPTGTILNTEIGNATGWLGRAWNWNDEAVLAAGYPAESPFNGRQIIQCASSDWYNQNWGTGADSKYIGCDMTGGSSGGPWIFKFGRPGQAGGEAYNWADGVNSHKRCTQAGCPEGSVLEDEMGSPPFTTESGGSEDFFAFLFGM